MIFGTFPMSVDEFAGRFVTEVRRLVPPPEWNDGPWTEAVKEALRRLCDEVGNLRFQAKQKSRPDSAEWLLDALWWREGEGCILAVESEWGDADAVINDFQKLVVCKAPLKLLVYWSPHDRAKDGTLAKIEGLLENYCHHLRGEVYLLVNFMSPLEARAYVAEVVENGRIQLPSREVRLAVGASA